MADTRGLEALHAPELMEYYKENTEQPGIALLIEQEAAARNLLTLWAYRVMIHDRFSEFFCYPYHSQLGRWGWN